MALIKCPECGNDISEMAEVCPNCGNPIKKKRPVTVKNNLAIKQKLTVPRLFQALGSVILAISPFLTYIITKMDLKLKIYTYQYNMWTVFSPEAGGSKTGDGIDIWCIIPTIIVLLGIAGIIIIVLRILNKRLPSWLEIIIPCMVTVSILIFENISLTTYRETCNKMNGIAEGVSDDFNNLLTTTRGIGFYCLIIGIILYTAGIIMNTKQRNKQFS